MADKKLNVGLIGLSHLHPRAYMPLFENCSNTEVVAVSDSNPELLKSFCEDFSVKGYADYKEMISNEKLDMAAIFLPHDECPDASIKCAENGIHLMVEKPIAQTADQVRRIAKAVEKNDVKITTGYCWRYHPVIKAMKDCIEKGMIGKVVSVEARLAAGRVDRYIKGNSEWMLEKAKSGGGPLYNLGVHWLDILCHLLQDEITDVCAINTQTSDAYDIEDGSIAMLKFNAGVVGVLTTSYIVPDCYPNGRDLYLGIKGTSGVLSYAPGYEGEKGSSGAGQTDVLELYSDSEKMEGSSARQIAFQLDKTEGYSGYMGKAYLEGFVDAIFNDKAPFINIKEAIQVLDVVDAIYKSDEQGSWVKV